MSKCDHDHLSVTSALALAVCVVCQCARALTFVVRRWPSVLSWDSSMAKRSNPSCSLKGLSAYGCNYKGTPCRLFVDGIPLDLPFLILYLAEALVIVFQRDGLGYCGWNCILVIVNQILWVALTKILSVFWSEDEDEIMLRILILKWVRNFMWLTVSLPYHQVLSG